jgi:hypothetical protein
MVLVLPLLVFRHPPGGVSAGNDMADQVPPPLGCQKSPLRVETITRPSHARTDRIASDRGALRNGRMLHSMLSQIVTLSIMRASLILAPLGKPQAV